MITPYLKKFNTEGGTLYVFPSVSKDLTRTFVSNDYEFKFSHFACLNLPDICAGKYDYMGDSDSDSDSDSEPMTGGDSKGLYISTLMGSHAPTVWTDNAAMENAITENLQNYVMNFETAILGSRTKKENESDDSTVLNGSDYDNDVLTTVSEKIFWNWLSKIGGINFNESGNGEQFLEYRDRTVQYIGNIDVMNTVEINGDAFEELYIHIPSTAGASTNVYFRTGDLTDNKNYLDKKYVLKNNGEYIIGRDGNSEHPQGLSTFSFTDKDLGENTYAGDKGHTIDFRDSSYGDGINNMNAKSLEDFEFNAVLIYYDIYKKTSTPGVKKVATNLYGILFLDNVTTISGEESRKGYIQRYPKQKETAYENGNSYALKIDLKIDTIGDTEALYYEILDPNSAVSMTLYVKALEQLQKCIDLFYTQKTTVTKLLDRVAELENIVVGIDTVSSLKADISKLYDLYSNNAVVDTNTLLGLIDVNAKKIESIMKGDLDLKLQYDTDVIQAGEGIAISKPAANKVVISTDQKYSINEVISTSVGTLSTSNRLDTQDSNKVCNIQLRPGENFAVIYLEHTGYSTSNLTINIDDSEFNWEAGQSMKIHFSCSDGDFVFDTTTNSGIIIKPNANTTLSISGYEIEGKDLIEVVCLGVDNFIYLIK